MYVDLVSIGFTANRYKKWMGQEGGKGCPALQIAEIVLDYPTKSNFFGKRWGSKHVQIILFAGESGTQSCPPEPHPPALGYSQAHLNPSRA